MPKQTCANCQRSLGFLAKAVVCAAPLGCGRDFCANCTNYALASDETPNSPQICCQECFKSHSTIDFDSHFQAVGPEKGQAQSVLFVHGGGGNRKMFLPHAKLLAETKGFRCVVMDLPGHGALMDTPLTLEASLEAIHKVASEQLQEFNGQKPILIAASLGGYIAMEFLGKYPDVFASAVITLCGQNVGVGGGLRPVIALRSIKKDLKRTSAIDLLSGLQQNAKSNGHVADDLLQELALRSGVFFGQIDKQIDLLRHSDPRQALPNFSGRILFINGTLHHRDAEEEWLKASKNGKLVVYDGADHFLSHDDRFMDRFIQDITDFIQQETQEVVDQQQVEVEEQK